MLTKQDLQQIGNVVEEKIETGLKPVHKDIKDLKKDSRYLRKSINLLIEYIEGENKKIKNRVGQLEEQIGIS